MPQLQQQIMHLLYGRDIWDGFEPTRETDLQGWNGEHPSLSRLVEVHGAKLAIDVGVWKGRSTITLALAMRDAGIDGCVIAIDTFLGSPEHWGWSGLFERPHGRPDLYERFLSNVHAMGVSHYVVPLPQTSTTAAIILRRLNLLAALVHVDAAHEYREALRDAEDYWRLLAPGGWLIGDDYVAIWPGVIRAANEFAARMVLPLEIAQPKWILRKPPGLPDTDSALPPYAATVTDAALSPP
jgi:predicted O-methyltransferase YrrM